MILVESLTNNVRRFADDAIYSVRRSFTSVTTGVTTITRYIGINEPNPSTTLDVAGGIKCQSLQINNLLNPYVPQYAIIMWAGPSESRLPEGWYFCNGQRVTKVNDTNVSFNTPDLRGRFVVCENPITDRDTSRIQYTRNESGGAETKIIDLSHIPSHTHNYSDKTISYTFDAGGSVSRTIKYGVFDSNNNSNSINHPYVESVSFDSGGSIRGNTSDSDRTTDGVNNKPNSSQFDVRPPYYALAYIILVGF